MTFGANTLLTVEYSIVFNIDVEPMISEHQARSYLERGSVGSGHTLALFVSATLICCHFLLGPSNYFKTFIKCSIV